MGVQVMTLFELHDELKSIQPSIRSILRKSKYDECDGLYELDMDLSDPEQGLLRDELGAIMRKLSDISWELDYLSKPISYQGTIRRLSSGRYGTEDGFYYTSGRIIEALIEDPYEPERMTWIVSSVEHDGKDYYIVNYPKIKMAGLQVRRRESRY